MPATEKQMKLAGRELRLRREGKVTQEPSRSEASRPMGAISDKNLRSFASWPNPDEQRRLATRELEARSRGRHTRSGFAKASGADLKFFSTASDDAIRRKNGET